MDPSTILVLVLSAGAAAFLVWVEINSRRNEASKKQSASLAQPRSGPLQKETQSKVESEIEKRKTA